MKVWAFLLFCLFMQPLHAQFVPWSARQGPASIRQKQENKYQDIWTLSNWFEQQHKVRLMDQWLALNSSSNPFEFYIGGQTTRYDKVVTQNGVKGQTQSFNMTRGMFGAYASIIGLEAEYTKYGEDFDQIEGSIHLRLLGRSAQGTNLTGIYGLRKRTYNATSPENTTGQDEKFSQAFAGADLTLNFTKYFGIEGVYKKYFKKKSDFNNELDGSRIEGTFFIDFNFLRVYGTWFQEKDTYNNASSSSQQDIQRRGVLGGIKFFF